MTEFTPFERHRLDRSHYGTICSRCGYLRCETCGVACRCPAEVKRLISFTQTALRKELALISNPDEVASSEVRLNAGRTSLTVTFKAPDGTVKMYRLTVEPI